MKMPLDYTARYITTNNGNDHQKLDGKQDVISVVAFGAAIIEEMQRLGISGDVHIVDNDIAKSQFPSSIAAVAPDTQTLIAMAFGVSLEEWDEFGPGFRTIPAKDLEKMVAIFEHVDKNPPKTGKDIVDVIDKFYGRDERTVH